MAEYPPLGKSFVLSYSNNDRDFPIVAIRKDPRVDNYRIPEDLSPHPDSKRWPNHVFTGAQPTNSDERVQWIYEILPSPWVPFTRYDDDLGPVQGRRRSVKNEGQVASLTADKRTTYEAREGSAIVYTELEETWSIKVDEDGNSLFPIRDRDFYDPSRGPVQERRQLFVPTGDEVGSLENVNGVITQTSYEPYNEFLSVKIVQTYKVDGPQLIGNTTDSDRQQATVTTQRKAAKDYIPPSNTATRTVEVSREDAESVIERVVETPKVFGANTFSIERPDPLPQKFRIAATVRTSERNLGGQAAQPSSLTSGQLSKSEQQINNFVKRVSETSRDATQTSTLTQRATDNDRQLVTVTETLRQGDSNEQPSARVTISSEALGNGQYIVTKSQVPEVFKAITRQKNKPDLTPQKFRAQQEEVVFEENVEGQVPDDFDLPEGTFAKSEQQVNKFVKRVSTTTRNVQATETINETVLTPDGAIAQRIQTLASVSQTLTPEAKLLEGDVEALGDGRTVKTEVRVPSVFTNRSVQTSRDDLTPVKFRGASPEIRREITIEGVVDPNEAPQLAEGQFLQNEQEVTRFVKRVTTNRRDISATFSLEESVLTSQGQLATRTLRLSKEGQTIQPSAKLIDGSIEALGDGRTIKTEVKVENVFDEKSITSERPDTIPPRFRSGKTETTEEFVEEREGGIDTAPELSIDNGEYRKTQQRITEFKQRTIINKKNDTEFDPLDAADYENSFGLKIPFVESIVDEIPEDITADVEPLGGGKYLVRDYDIPAFEAELDTFQIEYPTRINLNLPRVLRSISVDWDKEEQSGEYQNNNSVTGSFKSVSLDDRGTVSATLAATPKFNIDIEEIWGQNLPAKTKIFFIKGPVIAEQDILSKSGASQQWPVFKPQSHTITAVGKKLVGSASASVAMGQQITDETNGTIRSRSQQLEKSISVTPVIVNIPPCLNSQINLKSDGNESLTIQTIASISVIAPVSQTAGLAFNLEAEIDQDIPATSPTDVPRSGIYLMDSDIEFFKFGWFIVRATVFDASKLS